MTSASSKPAQPWLLPPTVVKVGGSLFQWPDLKPRLQQFLVSLGDTNVVIVPGGGKAADVIRELDRTHRLGDERSHWLALNALSLNARFLAQLLPAAQVIEGLNAARSAWRRGVVAILDCDRFARGDENRPGRLPHSWAVTSDSLAVRVAIVAGAGRLVLLKSAAPPSADWAEAARAAYVDDHFPAAVAAATFPVEALNLRAWTGA